MKVRHRTMLRPSLKTQCLKVLIAIEIAMLGVFGVVPASTIIGAFDIPLPTFAGMTPFTVPEARADIPTTLGYQGRLKNASGTALTGTYSFIFRVYASSTGGPLLWNETQSVVVDSGYFAVQLGSVTPFAMDMNQALYLTTEVSADGEMTPRVPINSVSFAYTAGGVNAFAAEPTSASGGRMYYNTATGNIYYFDAIASIWRQLTSTSTATNLSSLVFGNATGASLNLGNLNVTGTTNLMGLFTFVNGTGTSLSVTNLSTTNFTPTNITWANATGTNTTSTNLYASNANISNLLWNGATGTSLNVTQGTTLNTLSASGSSTLTTLNFTNATGTSLALTSLLVGGTTVCLSNGTNCPSSTEADTLASVTQRGASATTTVTLFGGLVTSNLTVTNTASINAIDVVDRNATSVNIATTNLTVTGTANIASLAVSGLTTLQNFTFANATGTTLTLTGALSAASTTVTTLNFTNATGSTIFVTNGVFGNTTTTNAFISNLTATTFNVTSFNPTNLTWVNATGTNTTSTNLYASNLQWNSATGTNLLVTGNASTSQLFVGGYNVCLSNGTNCPSSSAGSDDWTYGATNDFVRPNTNTTSLVLGASTVENAPYWFKIDATSSRAYFGAFGSSTNVVLGGPTSTITNTMFQLDGNDLFIAGNIGSASSVYTNGAFIAGAGTTLYGDGFITKTNGDIVIGATKITPNANNTMDLGSPTSSWASIYASSTIYGGASTNAFIAGDGSIAAPAYAFDSDTGIFRSTTNYIGFAGDGGLQMYIGGNLGIMYGTWRPGADNAYDLGDTSNYWKDYYISGDLIARTNNSVDLGNALNSLGNVYASGTVFTQDATSTNAPSSFFSVSNIATLPTQTTVGGQSVCLGNGTNCPASTESDTLASEIGRAHV